MSDSPNHIQKYYDGSKKSHTLSCILTVEIIENRADLTLRYGKIVVGDIVYQICDVSCCVYFQVFALSLTFEKTFEN